MQSNKLTRSRTDRLLGGVAGGVAAYLGVDPVLVRLGLVVLALFFNIMAVVVYFALWLIVPNEGSIAPDTQSQVRENVGEMQHAAETVVNQVRGMFRS